MERTVTVTGTFKGSFGGAPILGKPEYGFETTLILEHYYGKVKLGMCSGKGWEYIQLTKEEVYDLIVSLEESLHTVPLVVKG